MCWGLPTQEAFVRDPQGTKYAEVTPGDLGTLTNVVIQRQLLLGQTEVFSLSHIYINFVTGAD